MGGGEGQKVWEERKSWSRKGRRGRNRGGQGMMEIGRRRRKRVEREEGVDNSREV